MKSSNLIIPLSIVVAGMIIGSFTAGAIIYTSKSSSNNAAQALLNDERFQALLTGGIVADEPPAPQTISVNIEPVTEEDHMLGDLSAPVKLIDYSDLECPFCKRHHNTLKALTAKYEPESYAWVYRHLPLSFHTKAMSEAIASECVARIAGNGAFWDFIGKIYEVTTSNDGLDLDLLPEFAREAGVRDLNAFNSCYENEETRKLVEDDMTDAANAGGTGTPYTLLLSEQEIDDGEKADIFDYALSQGLEDYIYFADNNKSIGVSGALPQIAFEGLIDRLLALNNIPLKD